MNTQTADAALKAKAGMANGAQMRITEDEMKLIRATFKGNEPLLRLMRKMFLPELDPGAPIGQMIDLWMTVKIDDMTPEEAIVNLKARNTLITHVDQQLMSLRLIAQTEPETPEEAQLKIKANGNK